MATTMVLKVDLQCHRCYKKVKKVLCKFPEIRDQKYDEKENTVTITVVSGNPECMKSKIWRKAGCCITSIEIKPPEKPPPPKPKPTPPKEPEKKDNKIINIVGIFCKKCHMWHHEGQCDESNCISLPLACTENCGKIMCSNRCGDSGCKSCLGHIEIKTPAKPTSSTKTTEKNEPEKKDDKINIIAIFCMECHTWHREGQCDKSKCISFPLACSENCGKRMCCNGCGGSGCKSCSGHGWISWYCSNCSSNVCKGCNNKSCSGCNSWPWSCKGCESSSCSRCNGWSSSGYYSRCCEGCGSFSCRGCNGISCKRCGNFSRSSCGGSCYCGRCSSSSQSCCRYDLSEQESSACTIM